MSPSTRPNSYRTAASLGSAPRQALQEAPRCRQVAARALGADEQHQRMRVRGSVGQRPHGEIDDRGRVGAQQALRRGTASPKASRVEGSASGLVPLNSHYLPKAPVSSSIMPGVGGPKLTRRTSRAEPRHASQLPSAWRRRSSAGRCRRRPRRGGSEGRPGGLAGTGAECAGQQGRLVGSVQDEAGEALPGGVSQAAVAHRERGAEGLRHDGAHGSRTRPSLRHCDAGRCATAPSIGRVQGR